MCLSGRIAYRRPYDINRAVASPDFCVILSVYRIPFNREDHIIMKKKASIISSIMVILSSVSFLIDKYVYRSPVWTVAAVAFLAAGVVFTFIAIGNMSADSDKPDQKK